MTTPGANIILDTNDRIDCGVYADIFRPSEGRLVYKLFIGFRHDTTASQGLTDPEKNDHRRRKTFDSECRAYEIAAQAAFLRDHIPHSFRRCEIADVTEYGGSVADDYLLPCCYCMEYIEGRLFGYIYPYPDGNGRMVRFLMNVMLASGGYPWTVIRVEDRNAYLTALDRASIDVDISPFSRFLSECVERSLKRKKE
jgi:hypothetical protein